MECFFEQDDGRPIEVVLTSEEVACLSLKSADKGMCAFADLVEESIVDTYRGLKDVTRDTEGKSQIKEALIQTIKLFLEEEKHIAAKIIQPVNKFLTDGKLDESDKHGTCIKDKIETAVMLAEGFGLPNVQRIFKVFGGWRGLQDMFLGENLRQYDEFTADLRKQILETLERYFTCSDQEEDVLCSELKCKVIRYFAGIEFFI